MISSLLLQLNKLGFQLRKQERQELSELLIHSSNLLLKLDKLGFQPRKQERLELSGLIRDMQSTIHS